MLDAQACHEGDGKRGHGLSLGRTSCFGDVLSAEDQLNNLARRRHAALDHYALKDRTLIKMATDKG